MKKDCRGYARDLARGTVHPDLHGPRKGNPVNPDPNGVKRAAPPAAATRAAPPAAAPRAAPPAAAAPPQQRPELNHMVLPGDISMPVCSSSISLFDSGSGLHLCHDLEPLSDVVATVPTAVSTAVGTFAPTVKGALTLHTDLGYTLQLQNVYYEPRLPVSCVVSVLSCEEDLGLFVESNRHSIHVSSDAGHVCTVLKHGKTWRLDCTLVPPPATAASSSAPAAFVAVEPSAPSVDAPAAAAGVPKPVEDPAAHMWHKRLGHVSYHTLYKLAPLLGFIFSAATLTWVLQMGCGACMLGKAHAAPFDAAVVKGTCPGEYFHSDVMGPFPDSANKACYVVTLLDDFTNFAFTTAVQYKSQASGWIQTMIQQSLTQTGNECKYLRSDRGGEYITKGLQSFLQMALNLTGPTLHSSVQWSR